MDNTPYTYVFGPVLSGRLGRSLGLDLLGARICSMNCVYCEVGAVRQLTTRRAPHVPAQAILDELAAWEAKRLAAGAPLPEHVTLGGMGEPTLNSDLPVIIAGVRRIVPGVPVAVLTNASTFTDPEVRQELAQADVVLPSLDSLVPEQFQAVNRPHPSLDVQAIAAGIQAFRREFAGKIFLEVLLVAGVNDSDANLALLERFCKRLSLDRVDVVTLSRPGTLPEAAAVDGQTLTRWRERLGSSGGLAKRPEKEQEQEAASFGDVADRVEASLARRPQTLAQLAQALSLPEAAVRQALEEGLAQGRLCQRTLPGMVTPADPVGHTFFQTVRPVGKGD